MKIAVALLVLLLAAAWTGSQGLSFRRSSPPCCSKEQFSSKRIPHFKIQSYQKTPSNCPLKAVIVKLPKWSVCVDPEAKWFKDYLRKQEKPKSTSS
ncbi:CCL13 protein, partial [Chloropsis hardwickii]|nr:CCL13 protein [Chloropsis hardwickii]